MASRFLVPILFASLLGGTACNPPAETAATAPASESAAPAATTSEVVAELGSEKITLTELESWIKDDLFSREMEGKNPSALYEMRSEALERMIGERVLAAEAKRTGKTSEALVQEAVAAVAPVTDEQVKAFFEQNKDRVGGQSFEQLAPRIKMHLQQLGMQAAGEQLQQKLRASAGVDVKLAAPRIAVAEGGTARGPENAPITLIEFSDYQCPFCRRAEPTVKELLARYPTQIRFVYRHFPLEMHNRARPAAEAAVCAGNQGRFWEYHEKVFTGSGFEEADLERYAKEVGVDVAAFQACRKDGSAKGSVDKDFADGQAVGVTGTPAFFINGIQLSGARPVEVFVKIIEQELKEKGVAAAGGGAS